jgi:hypothetical protein
MSDRDGDEQDERPHIDLSPALGEAGHEVEVLGYEGIEDTGPVLGTDEEQHDADAALDIAAVEFGTD